MKRVLILLLGWAAMLTATAGGAWAQGTLSGLVRTGSTHIGESLAGATVRVNLLSQENPLGYGAETVSTGTGFIFINLPPGVYTVLATALNAGFAADVVEVLNGNTTVVDLLLNSGLGTGPQQPLVQLQGMAIVTRDSLGFLNYFLRVGADSLPSYRLLVGPESYVPVDSGALRPLTGQMVEIGGRLFGYSTPPMIVVTTIGRQQWRDPADPGHGGSGGLLYQSLMCSPELTRIELSGVIRSSLTADSLSLGLEVGSDSTHYILDFGDGTYSPPSDMLRPTLADSVQIVGGLTLCAGSPYPRILVYEIGGHLWRVPGDESGLSEQLTPVPPHGPVLPVSYLTAVNYPNPFNAQTTLRFTLPEAGRARLTVYDLAGRAVTRLQDGVLPAGTYTRTWDGAARASGLYFYALELGTERVVGRMVLLK